LGTSIVKNQRSVSGGIKALSTIAKMEFPFLLAQPGLVSPDHQGRLIIILQKCGDKYNTISRCSNNRYIENVNNPHFDKIPTIEKLSGKLKSQQMQKFQNLSTCHMGK
jgi:hypothetical protein